MKKGLDESLDGSKVRMGVGLSIEADKNLESPGPSVRETSEYTGASVLFYT